MLQARKTSRTARPTPAGPHPVPQLRPRSVPPPLPRTAATAATAATAQSVTKPKPPALPAAETETDEVSEVRRSFSGIAATIVSLDEATHKQLVPPQELAKLPVADVTREHSSPGESNRALARMFPVDPRTRVLRFGAAVALLIAYTTVAAFRWALRESPVKFRKVCRQALISWRTLFAQARYRVRVEWLHATAVAGASR